MKILIILLLTICSLQAGWMNVDSINVKQKWRNKKLNTDALLYVKSSDSLLDTANIYYISGQLGIGGSPGYDFHIYPFSYFSSGVQVEGYFTADSGAEINGGKLYIQDSIWIDYGSNRLSLFGDKNAPSTAYGYCEIATTGGSFSGLNNGSLIFQPASNLADKSIAFLGGTTGKLTAEILDTTVFRVLTDSVYIAGVTKFSNLLVDSIGVDNQPGLIKLDQYEMDLTGYFVDRGDLYFVQDGGTNMSAWKFYNAYEGTQALPNLRIAYATDSAASPGDPTTLTYSDMFSLSALTGHVGINTGLPSADYTLQVGGGTNIENKLIIDDSLRVGLTSLFNGIITCEGSGEGLILNRTAGSGYIIYQDGSGVNQWKIDHENTDNILEIFSVNIDGHLRMGKSSTPTQFCLNTSNGRVGIGTTSPDCPLHIFSASAGTVTPSGSADELTIENSANSGLTILSPDANYSSVFFGSPSHAAGGAISWKYDDSNMLISTTTDASIVFRYDDNIEAMRIDGDGKIVVGTANTDTDSKTILNGPVTFAASTTQDYKTQMEISTGLSYLNSNMYYSGGWQLYDVNRAPCSMRLYSGNADSYISFYTHNANNSSLSQAMIIDKNGDVGIGVTSPSGSNQLEVSSGTLDGVAYFESTDANAKITLTDGTSTQYMVTQNSLLSLGPNGGYASFGGNLNIDASGNVGIGTASYSSLLHVYKGASAGGVSATDALTIEDDNDASINLASGASQQGYVYFSDATRGQGYIQYDHASDKMFINVNGGTRVTIDDVGYVGIGTTSPSEGLDLNNDAIRVRNTRTPASASATGTTGTICWDASYIYVCVATNTWKRTAISTW